MGLLEQTARRRKRKAKKKAAPKHCKKNQVRRRKKCVKRKVVKRGEGGFEKGSTWVVDFESGAFTRARFIPAP